MKWITPFFVFALLLAGECGRAQNTAPAKPDALPAKSQDARDAARLLELATSLKTTMDATQKFEVSIKFIRQAEEIEALARTMRTRTAAAAPAPPQHPHPDQAPQK